MTDHDADRKHAKADALAYLAEVERQRAEDVQKEAGTDDADQGGEHEELFLVLADTLENKAPTVYERVVSAIRALEAKVREFEADENQDELVFQPPPSRTIKLVRMEKYEELRADRDRLAGEVETLKDDLALSDEHEEQAIASIARLTPELASMANTLGAALLREQAVASELAAARENEARWLWMFPADPLISVTERMQRVYRKWDGSDSWNDAVDAARRAGEGEK